MLFSQSNLNHGLLANTNDIDNNMEKLKFERISSYVKDQELYANVYHSPNHHTTSEDSSVRKDSSVIIIDDLNPSKSEVNTRNKKTKPEEYYDDDFSLFSASISQVIERKYRQAQQEKRPLTPKHSAIRSPSPIYRVDKTMLKHQTQNSKYVHGDPSLSASSIHHKHQQKHPITPRKRRNHQDNQHQHRKLSGSKASDTVHHHEKKMKLPQTKANGFHLLHKFISPNLEVDRITVKPHNSYGQPRLGLFNKGKSSSKATGAVPDLVFSESKFLERSNKNLRDYTSNSYASSNYLQHNTNANSDRKKQNCVSKYFKPKSRQQQRCIDNDTLDEINDYQNNPPSSYYFHKHLNDTSSHDRSKSVAVPPRRASYSQYQKYAAPLLSSPPHNYLALNNNVSKTTYEKRTKGATVNNCLDKKSNATTSSRHNKELSVKIKTKKDNVSLASSSNESIEKILKECKNAPQVSSFDYKHQIQDRNYNHKRLYERINNDNNITIARKPNVFHHMNQIPSYSRVKTPGSGAAENALNSSLNRQKIDNEPILIESSNDDSEITGTPHNHLTIENDEDMCHYTTPTSSIPEEYDENNLHQYRTYMREDNNEDIQLSLDTQTSQHHEDYFGGINRFYDDGFLEEWQIENSIISFSDEEVNSEYIANEFSKNEKVLPLQYKNKKRNHLESILNFWKDQYKRSL